ncbi:MAG TPA: MraY family glycosyltransferase [Phycisphaerae bacterium]|nr:undecaprenyl/decaprenyl-phosphate alpha-N-acetylglucosaminyl 1-phosphate transferase [Phycisphaerales bacterium]HRX86667.1 MraY family glycosyltransferase [Phycisphaerae bacterium]
MAVAGAQVGLSEMARAYWPVLAMSFCTALLATPLCRALALKRNIVDRPDDWLKPHHKPIPYLGGVAIFLGWLGGILLGVWYLAHLQPAGRPAPIGWGDARVWGLIAAGAITTAVGLFDDLRMASPRVKLVGNVVAALVLVACGIGADLLTPVLSLMRVQLPAGDSWIVWAYSIPLTTAIVVGACNATNLLDGMDGLCSGVLGVISLGFLILAVHLHTHSGWLAGDPWRVVLALAMMGAALGFLPYNRNPATIFMGDAGSMLLGLNAAVLILMFAEARALKWCMGAVVVMGLPLADMVLAMARRWRAQRPIMLGDRSHFYDQLRDRGWSVRRVVLVSYIVAGVFALCGCLAPIYLRTLTVVPFFLALLVATLVVIKKFRLVRVDGPKGDRCA